MHDWRRVSTIASTAVLVAGGCFGQQTSVPRDLAVHLQAAQTDLDSQKYREAIKVLRAVIAIQSQIRGAYYQLGFALFQLGTRNEAEKAFTKELDFQPPDPYSLYYLGRIRADAGTPQRAIRFFQESSEAGDVLDCRERLGSLYLTTGRLDEAIRFLQTSVKARPENGSLHYLLARAYKQKGNSNEAKVEFDAAARWKAKFREDMVSLSELRSSLLRKNQTGTASYVQELSASKDSDILMASATALGQAGMHEEAIVFLNNAISLNPNVSEAHYDLARAYIALDNQSAARPELEKAIALAPGFYEAELVLGTLLVDQGDGDAAIPHLREAAKVHEDNPKLLMMLGLQYYQRGYFADAIEALKKAIALVPADPDPDYMLIEAYYRNFEYGRALNLAQETAVRFPGAPMSHFQLGAQLNNMGHVSEAKEQLDLALAKDPFIGRGENDAGRRAVQDG